MKKKTSFVSGGLLFLVLLAMPLAAQNAALVGTVTDPQQSAMPNVTVTLTNLQTGVSQAAKTDTAGNYEFLFVQPGDYSLKAEQAGFKTFVQSSFTLLVDQRGRVDAAMQLGESATTVTVEAAPTGVQTESSALGDVVDNKKPARERPQPVRAGRCQTDCASDPERGRALGVQWRSGRNL